MRTAALAAKNNVLSGRKILESPDRVRRSTCQCQTMPNQRAPPLKGGACGKHHRSELEGPYEKTARTSRYGVVLIEERCLVGVAELV